MVPLRASRSKTTPLPVLSDEEDAAIRLFELDESSIMRLHTTLIERVLSKYDRTLSAPRSHDLSSTDEHAAEHAQTMADARRHETHAYQAYMKVLPFVRKLADEHGDDDEQRECPPTIARHATVRLLDTLLATETCCPTMMTRANRRRVAKCAMHIHGLRIGVPLFSVLHELRAVADESGELPRNPGGPRIYGHGEHAVPGLDELIASTAQLMPPMECEDYAGNTPYDPWRDDR